MGTPGTRRRVHRALEAATGGLSWALVTAPLWGALLAPDVWLVVLTLFCLYWLYRSLSQAIFGLVAYRRLRAAEARDWRAAGERLDGWSDLHHVVIVPTFGEPVELLAETLAHLAAQDFPHARLHVVLAFEQREPAALEKAEALRRRFAGQFAHLWTTFHPLQPGEVPGKAANLSYAVERCQRLLGQLGVWVEDVLVTVCDADSRLHPKYLSALSVAVLSDRGGWHRLYQPAILLHANLDRIPAPIRILDCLYSFTQLARLVPTYKLVTLSTYSLALRACQEAGYWDVNVIPEDSHMFFKLFFWSNGRARVRPIYLPVWADAAEGPTWIQTLVSHYRQMRRWAWGVSDVPYVVWNALARWRIPWRLRLAHAFHYARDHLLWPGHWFLLSAGLSLVRLLAPDLARSPFGDQLLGISSAALGACSVALLVMVWVDRQLRPVREDRPWDEALFLLSWALLPLLGFFLVVLPALDAHTRLLLGRPLQYEVTQKLASPRAPASGRAPLRERIAGDALSFAPDS
jgi:cellulose synthase/poly-beta-1,6-N-acetylglucosamine synthase-like glycosyltransferase